MSKLLILALLAIPLFGAGKAEDALAAAEARNKAQELTIQALKRAVEKTNVDATAQAADATEQRTAASTVTEINAVKAQQAVSDQKETAVRVEAKTDAAMASADHAAKTSESNSALIYASMLASILAFLGIALKSVLDYLSAGRILTAANAHQREVVSKLDAVRTNTDGMTDKIEQLAAAGGRAQGELDARQGRD